MKLLGVELIQDLYSLELASVFAQAAEAFSASPGVCYAAASWHREVTGAQGCPLPGLGCIVMKGRGVQSLPLITPACSKTLHSFLASAGGKKSLAAICTPRTLNSRLIFMGNQLADSQLPSQQIFLLILPVSNQLQPPLS